MDSWDLDLGGLGFGDDTGTLMTLVWILPLILFVFYGQRIQLHVTSNEIKKQIRKLDRFRAESRAELAGYLAQSPGSKKDCAGRLDACLEYFTIFPVDMDPAGIVSKVQHVVRSREDATRGQIKSMVPGITPYELSKIQALLEIASTLHLFYKTVNHLYLTAKKQKNFPLILPLQMMLPFVMEHADALRGAVPAFKEGQPVGDGIGPMVVGRMMLGLEKNTAALETVWSRTEYEGRTLLLLKAEGPASSVGRPGDAVESIMSDHGVDVIIMVDAALKMEGEDSAAVAHGFGAAIGGIGTERFQIEAAASRHRVPLLAIVVKQSVREAVTLMTREIADAAGPARRRVYEMIMENTRPGQSVLVVGVGNTLGVPQ